MSAPSPRKSSQSISLLHTSGNSFLGSPPRRSPTNNNGERGESSWCWHHAPTSCVKFAGAILLIGALLIETFMSIRNHSLRSSNANSLRSNDNKSYFLLNNNDNNLKPPPTYSILPKKIYSVIGLESSGTQFVSKIIEDALQTGPYREGSRPCRETCHTGKANVTNQCKVMKRISEAHACDESSDVLVQHFSLPWGGSCQDFPNPPIVDVVLPSECTRDQETQDEIEQCNAMAKDIWNMELNGKSMQYPVRYQLDITSNKQWYDAQGVEQYFIIVVRDDKISYTARQSHCTDPKLRQQEEDVGLELIVDAINTFILKDDIDEKNVTSQTFDHWVAKQYQTLADDHNNTDDGSRRRLSALPSRDNVVVVSYESLVKLKNTYVRMLYNTLGIVSDFIPDIRDSNEKYLNNTV